LYHTADALSSFIFDIGYFNLSNGKYTTIAQIAASAAGCAGLQGVIAPNRAV
jgi:hypothetical protein